MSVRDQILEAAARVYAETGYRGATTRRIATAAGVNEVTLFRHFGSKDALLHEAIARAGQELTGPELPAHPDDPEAELLRWARHHISFLRERRSLIRTCMGEIEEHPGLLPPAGNPPGIAATALRAYLRRLRETGLASAELEDASAAALLMGALFADAVGRDIMPQLYGNEPEEAVREYVRLFLRSIGVGRRSAGIGR